MDSVFLGANAASFERKGESQAISKITLVVDEENFYSAGDDTGYELTADCPWATQAMADALLTAMRGRTITAYAAGSALLDISAELGDGITVNGVYSEIGKMDITCDLMDTADVSSDVAGDVEQEYATVGSLTQTVNRVRKSVTELIVEAGQITAHITDVQNELESQITLTAESLTSQITDTKNGLESQIQQTTTSLTSTITDTKNDLESQIQQTSSSLTSQIRDAEDNISSIEQKVDNITLSVDNGEDRSSISLSVDGVEVDSVTVRFTGGVVFESDLAEGNTSINGACIDTGEIDVDYINLYGEMGVRESRRGSVGGYIGYCEGHSDTGIGVMEDYDSGQCICTNGGAKLAYGADDFYIGVSRSNVFASETINIDSDRRVKDDIRYDLDDYEAFFRALKPCSYKLKRGTSGRRHTGFIAQELEQALLDSGKTSADLAAYCYDPDARRYENTDMDPKTAPTGCYKIRYSELIALNTAMIQKLMAEVDALKTRVAELEANNNG